jgi:phospholipid transport system substrate-binding protein
MKALAKVHAALAIAVVLALGLLGRAAWAQADPAVGQIASFQATLLEAMKQGPALGAKGRARLITPAVEQVFDLPTMTRFAVGPTWQTMSPSERSALTEAFTRLTAASFARNFDSYSGERFEVSPKVETRGPDKLVQVRIVPAQGAPTALVYRMRQSGGTWKVIDVYYQGSISQLTTRRSDFAATVASGGEPALLAHLNAQTEKLLR